MAPTLAEAWKKIRMNDKNGLQASRSHSEVISGVRLQGLVGSTETSRSRASSIELRRSSRGTEEEENQVVLRAKAEQRSPERGSDVAMLEAPQLQLKVFVGSWNMAAKDPFVTAKTTTYIGDDAAADKLKDLLPPGYDLYVLGTQEKVSKHLHRAVLARLHTVSEHNGRRYFSMRQPSQSGRRRRSHSSSTTTHSAQSDEEPPSQRISHLGDVYRQGSFALEASASALRTPTNNDNNSKTTTNQTDHEVERVSIKEVRGRGDGAFINSKSTSLAIYCASDLAGTVEIVKSGAHKFSWSSGSKGGVAVMLSVVGGQQTIAFANCHLEANKPSLRRKQLAVLSTKLGEALGGDDLASSSDHVVWMGDFNYRIHSLDGDTVLKLLVNGKHLDVHDRYDSMKDDVATIESVDKFQEPQKWPSFYPTYKKIPGRPHKCDPTNPSWPTQVYRIKYKEPFYKGGKVKARVPGWCDRILYCSYRGEGEVVESHHSSLRVEKVACPQQGKEEHAVGRDNYRAVNDGLCESDHSPVFCTFQWTIAMEAPSEWD